MAAYQAQWVEPIRVDYRGYQVCEIPPNGQGIVALMALNILKEFDFSQKDSAETCHKQLEAIKIAFADAFHYVTDPTHMRIDYHTLLDPAYAPPAPVSSGRGPSLIPMPIPPKSGTVYMCAPTARAIWSPISSPTYMGFGSGIVVRTPAWRCKTGGTISP